ncbi:MAG: exodeoxyribonuclease VII large subunit, partial [Planctomycetota bacterium]
MHAQSGAGSSERPAGDDSPLSVSQLAARIARALETGVPAGVRVIGEVSGARERTHWYFDLKDGSAVVSCVLFASAARRIGASPENGRTFVLRGRVEFYPPSGRTTLIVDRLEPVGVGELELGYRKLCDELRALGWFDDARKRAIPTLPRRVAVVTSATSAALQDVLSTARKRFPGVEWGLVDVPVQGDGAAERIAGAIDRVGAYAQ